MHTDLTGATSAVYTSLPFGDGGAVTNENEEYATWAFNSFGDMDFDGDSNTYRAQFRQYNQAQARWMSPDPYDGSYDPTNPQSFNRYAYVGNNPIRFADPSGLHYPGEGGGGDCANDPNCGPGGLGGLGGEPGFGGYGGDNGSSLFGDPWGGAPGSPLDSVAAGEELQWLGSGSIPWYSVQGGELMLLVADPWAYVTNASIFTWEQVPTWFDLGATAVSSGTYSYFGGVPGGGGGGGGGRAPRQAAALQGCSVATGFATAADDLNPFSFSLLGVAQDASAAGSQAFLSAAAQHSLDRGLTLPLRSSIVRAGMTNAEALGELSGVLAMANFIYALGDGVVAEDRACL